MSHLPSPGDTKDLVIKMEERDVAAALRTRDSAHHEYGLARLMEPWTYTCTLPGDSLFTS